VAPPAPLGCAGPDPAVVVPLVVAVVVVKMIGGSALPVPASLTADASGTHAPLSHF